MFGIDVLGAIFGNEMEFGENVKKISVFFFAGTVVSIVLYFMLSFIFLFWS